MPKSPPAIAELFQVPSRFLRAVQLERDFLDGVALDRYVLTPPMAEAFRRIADGLRVNSGRRAWRITGDFGAGKSSFALVLAHLVSDRSLKPASRIADLIGWPSLARSVPPMWPVLLTGSRTGIVPALARAVSEAVAQRKPIRGRMPKVHSRLIARAADAEASGQLADLEGLIGAVREQAAIEGAGLLLIIDELGKFLEHAAQRPDREDVFVLQRLAEAAARSQDQPFLVLGLLHQGFQAYSERLPSSARHEWEKVAGRFDEIVFDQPLAHTAALVTGALNVNTARLPKPVRDAARAALGATAATGWLGGATSGAAALDVVRLYPLHPTLLPVLVRFFARFGQHERSLFGFLLSSEPFGLQFFAIRAAAADAWYTLPDFYDYVRANFGHRLAGASYRNHWLRIVATIDAAAELGTLEQRILKAVAVLNLLDAEDLLANDRALKATFTPLRSCELDEAISGLVNRGLLFRRNVAGSYRLWPNSSVSLETALKSAERAIGPIETVASGVEIYVDREPIVARRHYVERGTLRYFEVRHVHASILADALAKSTEADGLVIVALADTEAEQQSAATAAVAPPFADRKDVVIAITLPLLGVTPELYDVRCWQWIVENTPELADDNYAAAEVSRQFAAAQRALRIRLTNLVGLRGGAASKVEWFRSGGAVTVRSKGGLSGMLSDVCDEIYPDAPLITNELLNRNTLGSAAAAARMRLIEGLFNAGDRPYLGIDSSRAPPERSMYLSVLQKGAIHITENVRHKVVEPTREHDPLRLRPALDRLIEEIKDARGDRVSVVRLLARLKEQPLGVRAGVAPLLLAIILQTRGHQLAVYEHGTFLHHFGPSDFLRLTKSPGAFEIQHCQVEGVRLEVFNKLAATFAARVDERRPDLMDVVRPLCHFAAQLPEYTRRIDALSPEAISVRSTLLSAREPSTMLFRDLPEACGVGPFPPDQGTEPERVHRFVSILQDAVGELRSAYSELLARLVKRVADAAGDDHENFDRARLAARAARVSLAAREPRLRTFAHRLRDPGLSDEAWVEALASFIAAKPPARWAPGDEARFGEEIAALAELFHKVEAVAFSGAAGSPTVDAIRLNLTRGDGEDLVRVIEPRPGDDDLSKDLELLRGRLPQDRNLRLQLLTQLLWSELKPLQSEPALMQAKTNDGRAR